MNTESPVKLSIYDTRTKRIDFIKDGETLISIDLRDGTVFLSPNYKSSAAAKIFWEAVSEEYRCFLAWKRENDLRSRVASIPLRPTM